MKLTIRNRIELLLFQIRTAQSEFANAVLDPDPADIGDIW